MAGRYIHDLDEGCGESGCDTGTRTYAHAWSLVRRYTRHRYSRNHTCAHGPTQQHDWQHTAGHRHRQAHVYPDCDRNFHSHAIDV